ncbi:unnamed protein product [Lathyrus oleraceus]|uniref:uncharacterized protein LOC127074038 n=1 Tax=Pisum sativum TaxID=3888 RepID=UPI0021CFA4FB|nr:uncharacterized protein LOC127074038 [Pisum sativum]
MDGRGGCCIVRNATGAYDMSTMERIMLRFRPIAPKPSVARTTASEGSSSESGDAFHKTARARRKYVKQNSTTEKRRIRRKKTVSSTENNHPVPVTLPLLPETPDPKESPVRDLTLTAENKNMPLCQWLSFENHSKIVEEKPYVWYGAMDPVTKSYYSSVTVECVMDAWVEGEGLGSTDEERRMNMSVDTCPGFISDGYGRVTWTNGAYREMMGEGGVALLMKVSGVVMYPSFTCRVRVVQFECGNGREKNSLTLPCDVWRMDFGGFAWRLDVKAALSLRLGC